MPDPTPIPAPFDAHRETVQAAWMDYNDHLNVAYYLKVFDHATDAFFDFLGIGEAYRRRTNCSTFALEAHIVYAREVKLGDQLRVTTQLVAHDAKRMHVFHRMHHAGEGYLAATHEFVSLHVDLGPRRAAKLPPELLARVEAVAAAHAALPRPPELGRAVRFHRGTAS